MNPRAEVPAIVDGDFTLYDSTIICEYLEERHPDPPLYPRDARRRATCRLLEDLADTQLDAAVYALSVVEYGRGESYPEMHAATGRDLQRLYDELVTSLGEQRFFCGEFSMADISIIPHLTVAMFLGFPVDATRHAALARWMERVQERPSVVRDNADVMSALQQLQAEGRPGFDPYTVQWRSDRLEWVIKNGFANWFMDEMRAGRAFFPLARQSS